ncbi:MAG: fibronectin type III domain-containing protein [Bryobacterales bacterium]|nr:fibronectin type III domain-containing protein [Acidobacteriota bacterium]MCB9384073.1 fibronectin type III domain-containing protein [Bryobacterales bacterium]
MHRIVGFARAATVAAALSLALPASLPALCPQNISLVVGDRTIDFAYQTDAPGARTRIRIAYGLTSGDYSFQSRYYQIGSSTAVDRFIPFTGLAPSTTYYFDPQVSTPNGDEWSSVAACQAQICPSVGAQPGGYTCENVAGTLVPKVTTLPLDAPAARLPTAPTHDYDPTVIPTVNGTTFTVGVDGDGYCTDFQAQINACAAANTALNHQILIPSGATCRPELEGRNGYDLPARFGAGNCIVRSDANPLLLPPPGVRADPTFRNFMAHVESNRNTVSMDNASLLSVASCTTPPCTEGWRFENIVFQHPPHEARVRNRLDIVSVDSANGLITVSAPHGYSFFDLVQVNAPGIEDYEMHRACRVASSLLGSTTFRCFGKEGGLTGTYSGGGSTTDAISVPLLGCSAGSPSVCTTSEPHGFGNFFSFPIASISNGTVTFASTHKVQDTVAVKVEGTPGGTWDGIYKFTNKSSTSATLVGLPGGACTPCSGTVRQLAVLEVFDVRGADEASVNKVHLFTVLDQTRIQLEQSSATGTLSGGYVSYDPTAADGIFSVADARRLVFDRCIVDLRGAPYRNTAMFIWTTTRPGFRAGSAVINSWLREDNAWFGTNPVTLIANDTGASVFSTVGFGHQIHRAKDLQLRNNMMEAILGITVFADVNTEGPEDISIVRNVFWYPERYIGGRAEARGRYYLSRHHVEFKSVQRALVRGNFYQGNPANGQPTGISIALPLQSGSATAIDRTLRDIEIEYNTFYKNAGFIDLFGINDNSVRHLSPQRIRVIHNLAANIDVVRFRTFPAGQAGTQDYGWRMDVAPYSGRVFGALAPFEDLRVEQNTVLPTLGGGPHLWLGGSETSGGLVVANNITPLSETTGQQYGIRGDTNSATYQPAPESGFGYAFWKDQYRQGPGVPDPLALWDNVVMPCTDIAENEDREAALLKVNSMASFAANHLACAGGCPPNFVNQVTSTDGMHCKDREQSLFGSSTDFRLPSGSPYSSYGADIDAIHAAQGRVYDVAVSANAISATISYRTLDAAACFVDLGTDKLFSTPVHTRLSDGGGSAQRSVVFPGLSSLTTYHYRVLCPADQPRGVFVTPPGGPL